MGAYFAPAMFPIIVCRLSSRLLLRRGAKHQIEESSRRLPKSGPSSIESQLELARRR